MNPPSQKTPNRIPLSAPDRRVHWVLFLIGLLLTTATPFAQKPVDPPLGLRWQESAPAIEQRLRAVKANVVSRKESRGKQIWEVTGIQHPGLKQVLFYFKGGLLAEVELQYENAAWSERAHDDFFKNVCARLEKDFGRGTAIANSRQIGPKLSQTIVGFQWDHDYDTIVRVFFFSAQEGNYAFRSVSLHYIHRGSMNE